MILVGDVGGTNVRFGLARREEGTWRLSQLKVEPTPGDLAPAVRAYLAFARPSSLEAVAICGAGPKKPDGTITLTNCSLRLDPAQLGAAAGGVPAHLLNDFEAIAWSLLALGEDGRRGFGRGETVARGPRVVLGAGTGLGVGALVPHGTAWAVVPGEGGHADVAPVDDTELKAWTALRTQLGRVTAEHVFSGPGLERLHQALHGGAVVPAKTISEQLVGGDADATATVRVFCRWLGREAGNLALTVAATGGVYLAGGIVPGWKDRFDGSAFREGFEDKAPFADWLKSIPTFVVTHPQPGLLGLAEFAASTV